jgi:Sap-like sulfolipid-1-addressing protein
VIAQVAGLALLASLSPTALLAAAVYLGSARPRQTTVFYLAGAVLMSTIIAVVVLVVLRTVGLSRPDQHTPRYGLRLGLGLLLFLVGAVIVARRRRRAPGQGQKKKKPGLVSRMIASPSPLSAFIVGMLLFAPGVTFLAAVQVIATARADVELTTTAVAVAVVIDVVLVWLPLVFYLIAPGLTQHRLKAFNGWLRAHGSALLVGAIFVVGAIMIADGGYGLIAHA